MLRLKELQKDFDGINREFQKELALLQAKYLEKYRECRAAAASACLRCLCAARKAGARAQRVTSRMQSFCTPSCAAEPVFDKRRDVVLGKAPVDKYDVEDDGEGERRRAARGRAALSAQRTGGNERAGQRAHSLSRRAPSVILGASAAAQRTRASRSSGSLPFTTTTRCAACHLAPAAPPPARFALALALLSPRVTCPVLAALARRHHTTLSPRHAPRAAVGPACAQVGAYITERDAEVLKHLVDVSAEVLTGDERGFQLVFHFDDNKYFSNKVESGGGGGGWAWRTGGQGRLRGAMRGA